MVAGKQVSAPEAVANVHDIKNLLRCPKSTLDTFEYQQLSFFFGMKGVINNLLDEISNLTFSPLA